MIKKLNIETGSPDTQTAIQRLKNTLPTYKRQGCKAVLIVHGYGSTGTGGSIKTAVRRCLSEPSMVGLVRLVVAGEDWINRKRDALSICGALAQFEREIASNPGITLVILR